MLLCSVAAHAQVFDIASGEQLALLSQGHYDTVTACAYSPHTQQLFSAATDGVVLVWEPWTELDAEAGDAAAAAIDAAGHLDRDWWLAAASGRRQQQQQQQQQPSGTYPRAARAASRLIAADIDAWSEDDGML
jgi:predicted phage tail protein